MSDFAGRWALARVITPDVGPAAAFDGHATWSPQGDDLAYAETGTLRMAGQPPMTASRVYLWKADLSVWFDDGRYFHTVPAQGGATDHWCDPDQYDVRYDFAEWPDFRVTWRVEGPRKSYTMVSDYTPST